MIKSAFAAFLACIALIPSAAAQDGWPAFQALKDYIVLANELTGFDAQADLEELDRMRTLVEDLEAGRPVDEKARERAAWFASAAHEAYMPIRRHEQVEAILEVAVSEGRIHPEAAEEYFTRLMGLIDKMSPVLMRWNAILN